MKRILGMLFVLVGCISAQEVDTVFLKAIPPVNSDNSDTVKAASAKAVRDAAKSSHDKVRAMLEAGDRYLIKPFLIADNHARTVQLWSGATGMGAREPAEFFVIGPDSGNDYESIAVTYAKPSDVHDALVFIGLKPGWPVDPGRLRFWPKGDRVQMHAQVMDPDGELRDQRIEEYIIDVETGLELTLDGFVFVGSMRVDEPGTGKNVYGADVFSPNAVASDYNEVNTVLDLPRQGSKGEVYGNHVCNPTWAMDTGHPMMITLRPHAKLPEVTNVQLHIDYVEDQLRYQLKQPTGEAMHEQTGMSDMLGVLEKLDEPFGEVHMGRAVPLGQVVEVCGQLEKIETVGGLRIDPPPAGHVYYKTFLPQLEWLKRDMRPSQPFELYVRKKDGATRYEVILAEEKYGDEIQPEIIPHTFPAANAEDLAKIFKEQGEGVQTLFLLVDASITYGEVMDLLTPHMARFPVVYVFQL